MAKIVIGNVKGKDGRGISKIIKTASTGTVDTYTITYTDSTTSTFTINHPDSISLQRQIVPSAAVESSTTASQAYAAGNYVVVNGVLRKVTAAIAKGNTIGDSNSTATTVTGELATIWNSVSRVLAKPGITLNGTVTVPGLKKRAAVTVVFGHGQHAIMPTADGTHVVSGAMGGNGSYSVTTANATAHVSGETVTFNDVGYNTYLSPGLGSALKLAAGDKETITAIYG